ncbi:MAG: glycosyltransferase family 2 protein [Mycobacterium sp.]|uniref:glycosyltransferase family 2 protein n=1 Tax=Mycobacterium sp. TaxID=1785 RepID=UPI003F9A3AF1
MAAIPNYNMGDHLRRLLPQVLAQNYDGVVVLDDASVDHSIEVISEFGDDVKLVRSSENRGAGANRNQIIDNVDDGTIIHFIDADMDLETAESPSVARELVGRYADQGVGMIGGLVSLADGSQEYCNYGAVFSLWGNFTSNFPRIIDNLRGKPRLAGAIGRMAAPIMRDWPNVLEPPAPTPAYWVHEGNMLVESSLFKSVGGYDVRLRSHEIQDLAIRLDRMGVKRQFDPSIRVVHHHIDVRGKNRNKWANKATLYLIRKHGLLRFLTDR